MTRILVIDDEALVRTTVKKTLDKAGYYVLEASDGETGIALYQDSSVDLIITDILMPGMDGFQILKAIRSEDQHIKVIAISGGGQLNSDNYLGWASTFGANVILDKPFGSLELLAAVEHALAT
jgi:CheY-like chemotaxis protein